MRGSNELRALVGAYLSESQHGGVDRMTLLQRRVEILERVVYYLMLRERDEMVAIRRMANRLDTDLALLQSFVRSVQGATDGPNSDTA